MDQWLPAYVLTCAIEIPIVFAMISGLAWRLRSNHPRLELLALAWALQLTHPVLWLVNPPFPTAALLAEAVIVLVEGTGIYAWAVARTDAPRGRETATMALAIALCANAASLLAGLLLSL